MPKNCVICGQFFKPKCSGTTCSTECRNARAEQVRLLWRRENAEKIYAQQKTWAASHPSLISRYTAAWRAKNPDYSRDYNRANRDRTNERRRARSASRAKHASCCICGSAFRVSGPGRQTCSSVCSRAHRLRKARVEDKIRRPKKTITCVVCAGPISKPHAKTACSSRCASQLTKTRWLVSGRKKSTSRALAKAIVAINKGI